MGSFFRRAAFALRFADLNTLISGQVTGDSRILMVRNIRDIVEKAAPFLHADADPYTVIVDGRLVWVIDLYTTTDRYPYSTPAYTGRLNASRSGLPDEFNYIRNSVKATVDAYDGTVTFYVVDETDPLLRTYRGHLPQPVHPDGGDADDAARAPALPGGPPPGAERHIHAVPRHRPAGVLQQHPGLADRPRPVDHRRPSRCAWRTRPTPGRWCPTTC